MWAGYKGIKADFVIASVSEAISLNLLRLLRLRPLVNPRKDTFGVLFRQSVRLK